MSKSTDPRAHTLVDRALHSPGEVLFARNQGQFADARHMSYESIKAFFEHWKPKGS